MPTVSEWWHTVRFDLDEAGAISGRACTGSSISRAKVRDWMSRDACISARRTGRRQQDQGRDRVNLYDAAAKVRQVYAVVACKLKDDQCEGGCLG